MEEKIDNIIRSPGLESLLKELKQQDSLFDYNVPAHVRKDYEDSKLINHLDETYSKDRFIIDDPAEIAKYVMEHDIVIKKGDSNVLEWQLKKGEQGEIINIEDDKIMILFPKIKLTIYIPKTDFEVYCTGGFFGSVINPAKPGDKIDNLNKGAGITYTGANLVNYLEFIPNGTEGIVGTVYNNSNLGIIWAENPGLKVRGFPPNYTYNSSDVELLRKNRIDFKQLRDRFLTLSAE